MSAGNQKTIFVTGATGRQGGAVARSLLNSGFNVKALVRNPASANAQILDHLGAEIIEGDLNNPASFSNHIKTADGIFCVLTFKNGTALEIKQGFTLANLAKQYNINHFVYSSVIAADLHTGISHWESKYRIENHIKEIGLPYTIIRPTSLYENFLIPQVKKRILKGNFPSPIDKEKVQQFISAKDIGEISAAIFKNKDKYINKTFAIAAEQMSMGEVAKTFSTALNKKIKYQKIPAIIVRLILGKTVFKIVKWVNDHDGVFVKDIAAFRHEFPGMTSLEDWVKINFASP